MGLIVTLTAIHHFHGTGAHLVFDNSLDPSLQLFSLCFWPSPLCIFFLWKGKGTSLSQQIDMWRSWCLNLNAFSYLSAAKEATHSPCTNMPVICPLCPSTSSAVWKYNLKAHFEKFHISAVCFSESEREGLKKLWNSRFKKWRQSKSSKPKSSLPISEAHSSCRVFSWVSMHLLSYSPMSPAWLPVIFSLNLSSHRCVKPALKMQLLGFFFIASHILIKSNMFFLKLPFSVRHISFRKVGGEGGHLQMLKKIYRPRVIFKVLGPPCPSHVI